MQSVDNVRCQLIRAIIGAGVARFLEERELLPVLLILERDDVISGLHERRIG